MLVPYTARSVWIFFVPPCIYLTPDLQRDPTHVDVEPRTHGGSSSIFKDGRITSVGLMRPSCGHKAEGMHHWQPEDVIELENYRVAASRSDTSGAGVLSAGPWLATQCRGMNPPTMYYSRGVGGGMSSPCSLQQGWHWRRKECLCCARPASHTSGCWVIGIER
ncbi:unnamed protein product [Durusdinium trenchii]|uniref:Uncharacterized protein n=1 Tax=Durusdinium trenchii TaxID=1381693 RepID=A0ABP0HZ30_9DINO